jgi:signal transduction histidine kinase
LDILPDIVYQIDLEGRFVYVNGAVKQMGYEEKDLIGQHYSILFESSEDVEQISRLAVLNKIREGKLPPFPCPKLFDEQRTGERRTEHLEVCLKHKGGEICPTKLSSFGDISSQGFVDRHSRKDKRVVSGTIGVIHDVTNYKLIQNQLKDTLRKMQAEEAERMQVEKNYIADRGALLKHSNELETFAYRVAHDLKSPLLFIRSMVELYRRAEIERELFLEKLENSLSKSISMVNGLYNLGRLKRKDHHWTNVSLHEMVSETAQWFEQDMKTKKIDFTIDCPDEVYAIEDVLPLVFLNLISNAMKYNRSENPCIRISSCKDGDKVLVKIEDNGPGLPVQAQDQIFEAFVQLDKTRLTEGLGVGLNTVRNALVLHESQVWVGRSDDLGGASLSFKLKPAKTLDRSGSEES